MNADVKRKWMEALRSGAYRQARTMLHHKAPSGDYFCCLGVLCDLAIKAGVSVTVGGPDERVFYNENSIFPPGVVMEWAGRPNPDQFETLARLNDEGQSFAWIADYIEDNL